MRLLLVLLLLAAPASAQNATGRDPLMPSLFGDQIGRLPEALQQGWGLFAASLLAWAVLGLVVVLVLVPLVKSLVAHTRTKLDGQILALVTPPGFLLVFIFGLIDSLRVFDLPPRGLQIIERAWEIAVIAVLAYVAYNVWHVVMDDLGRRTRGRGTTSQKLYPVFDKVGGVLIFIAGVWFVVASLGVNMTFFAAGAGIGGLVIAFAAQDTLANFFAGIHILLDQPFREGDRIEIKEEETWGDVVAIGLRTTRIRTLDNRLVIVPNNVIGTNPVINHSYPTADYRLSAHVGVAYRTDPRDARSVLINALKGVEGVLADREIQALFRRFGESSLEFEVRYWIHSYQDTRVIEDRAHNAIYDALHKAGIEIPFPQRVLWNGAGPRQPVLDA